MADRQVTRSRKDRDGDILALCNTGEWWSPHSKLDAINDIEIRRHRYFVQVPGSDRADVHVVQGRSGKHLRTTPDAIGRNNLDNLPEC